MIVASTNRPASSKLCIFKISAYVNLVYVLFSEQSSEKPFVFWPDGLVSGYVVNTGCSAVGTVGESSTPLSAGYSHTPALGPPSPAIPSPVRTLENPANSTI